MLITGATGWLGREVIARLSRLQPNLPVLPVASRSRVFDVGKRDVRAVEWNHKEIASWGPTLALHLAYLTPELEQTIGTTEYEAQNRRLTEQALRLYSLPTIRGVVSASSGAAIAQRDTTYGRMKARDETAFLEAGESSGVPTIIARIWSVTGVHCTKPDQFAFFDLIRQTQYESEVHICSAHEVWRRYVDAGEYLDLCLAAVSSGSSGVIDSGGELIEIGDLAAEIQNTLGIQRPISRPEISGAADIYASDGLSMRTWADSKGLKMSSILEQIVRVASNLV